ncbi:hypothetical protein D9M71_648980 [compost metagenome]
MEWLSSQTRKRMVNSGTMRKMYTFTPTFISDSTRNSCGIDSPATDSSRIETIAAATMNSALRMLFAAITRARLSSAVRDWISAYSGTM